MHERQRVKTANVVIVWIGDHEHKPQNFDYFRNKKNEFCTNYYTPALHIGNAIAKHETAYPDHKRDNRKLP